MEDDFRGGFGEESRGAPQWHNHQQNGWETYRGNMPGENHIGHPMRDDEHNGFVSDTLLSSLFFFPDILLSHVLHQLSCIRHNGGQWNQNDGRYYDQNNHHQGGMGAMGAMGLGGAVGYALGSLGGGPGAYGHHGIGHGHGRGPGHHHGRGDFGPGPHGHNHYPRSPLDLCWSCLSR